MELSESLESLLNELSLMIQGLALSQPEVA